MRAKKSESRWLGRDGGSKIKENNNITFFFHLDRNEVFIDALK